FGRGDKATVGFCVGITEEAPARKVKEIIGVLDDEPLLTPNLLRLTRWMADYYLCGWGQVLNIVVPAGAKQQAGMRNVTFIEALPDSLCPNPLPALTPKQAAVYEHLRTLGRPIEAGQLAKLAHCGAGVIRMLIDKNLVRRVMRRVENVDLDADGDTTAEPGGPPDPLELNADQAQAWA